MDDRERTPIPEAPEADAPAPDAGARWLYRGAGWGALGLGGVGIFLPVVPTTPFVLVAAWCFSRSSPRLHRWLLEHPRFGPVIRDWDAHGVIRLRAKLLATAVIVPTVGFVLLGTDSPPWSKLLTLVLVAWGLTYVWTRPSRPPDADASRKLEAVRLAAGHEFPTADIEEMLREIEEGYAGGID